MNICIEHTLITQKDTLRTGALHLLHVLKQEGFSPVFSTDALQATILELLKDDALVKEADREECQALIEFDKSEGLYIFWVGEDVWGKGTEPVEFAEIALKGKQRVASLNRTTSETAIQITINLDGSGQPDISTGLHFFDHMLEQIARHGLTDLTIQCDGDLQVDEHHTIEDVAIALGQVITKALGDKKGIERYAFVLPMDEASATVSLDLSGRPYLVFEGEFTREYVGDMPTEMVKHFFYSLAMNLQATLHIRFDGENDHHKIESIFKGFARVLKTAVEHNPRIKGRIPSSKGTL